VSIQNPKTALLLSAAESAELLGMSRASFWALHASGRVPLPVRLGARMTRWRRDELLRWVEAGCPARLRWQAQARGATA
jgi:predicted DNA-binding transcriptional regulator AlpA